MNGVREFGGPGSKHPSHSTASDMGSILNKFIIMWEFINPRTFGGLLAYLDKQFDYFMTSH